MAEPMDILKKVAIIKSHASFAVLSDEEAEQLASLLTEKEYRDGEVIVKQGDPVDSIFFIVNGVADVRYNYIEDNQRKFKPLAKLTENQTIGLSETGLYSLSGVRTATVVAEGNVFLLRLSTAALNGFALANPHVGRLLHKNASLQDE